MGKIETILLDLGAIPIGTGKIMTLYINSIQEITDISVDHVLENWHGQRISGKPLQINQKNYGAIQAILDQ